MQYSIQPLYLTSFPRRPTLIQFTRRHAPQAAQGFGSFARPFLGFENQAGVVIERELRMSGWGGCRRVEHSQIEADGCGERSVTVIRKSPSSDTRDTLTQPKNSSCCRLPASCPRGRR